jgi:L-cysteine desulfidase
MKNGLGVTVPGTGMVGIAAALGAIGGNAQAGLEVLKDATADALVRASPAEAGKVQVKLQEPCDEILYSRACVYAGELGNGDHRGRAYPGGGSGLPGRNALYAG